MNKVKLGPQTLLYPMPALLIGANVRNKPNFMTVAWAGIANGEPPMISIAVRNIRYTAKGIRSNRSFSVNIPSIDLLKETDFCGISSGAKIDKVKLCNFKVFYGNMKTAPLIEQCPINMECSVVRIMKNGSHELIVGKIEETYVNHDCLTNGEPDASKIAPLMYITGGSQTYRKVGKILGRAFSIGKVLKQK